MESRILVTLMERGNNSFITQFVKTTRTTNATNRPAVDASVFQGKKSMCQQVL